MKPPKQRKEPKLPGNEPDKMHARVTLGDTSREGAKSYSSSKEI